MRRRNNREVAGRLSAVYRSFATQGLHRIALLFAVVGVTVVTQLASSSDAGAAGSRGAHLAAQPPLQIKPTPGKKPASIINYTALGDSLAFGTGATNPATGGYVPVYKSFLEADTGDTVVLDNRGVFGFTSANLLNALLTDSAMRLSVQNANVITLNVGGNDLALARVQYKNLTCGGADGQDCLRSARDALIADWTAIVAELLVLRASPSLNIRVIDIYNPFVAVDRTADTFPGDGGLNDLQVLKSYLIEINDHIAGTASANGFALGRVSRSFNGVSGDFDPGVGFGLLAVDAFHPNDLGHQIIAQQIRTGITPCLEQPNNIAAWYKGENNGNDVFNLNNATPEGALTFADGKVGQGFNLDGVNDSVLLPNFNLGDSYTIEFWIKPPSAPVGSAHLVSNGSSSTSFGALYLKSNLSLEYRQNGFVRATTAAGIVPVNEFTHISITRDAADGRTRIYRNAVLRATSGIFSAPFNNQLRVGFAITPSDIRFKGVMDEVALYSRALSSTEIQSIFNADTDGKCLPGQRFWDGGGTTSDWSEAGNWSGNVVPAPTETVIFSSLSAKDAEIVSATTIGGVQINSDYTGTITLSGSTTDLTVGSSGFAQNGGTFLSQTLAINGNFSLSAGTFSGASSTIDLNGSADLSGGTFTSTSGTLSIGSDFRINGSVFNHNNGTVVFDSPVQSLISIGQNQMVFNNVSFTSPDITFLEAVDGTSWITAVGEMNFSQGGIQKLVTSPAIPSFRAEGNVTMAGFNFNGNFSLRFEGAASQTFTQSGGINFDGWTVDKSIGSVSLSQNTGINALFLENGTISTGANVLSATTVTRDSGYVIGSLLRSFSTTGAKIFDVGTANGYSPVTVDATTVSTPSTLTISATQGAHPLLNAALALGRFWTITESGDLAATLTFNYLDPTDINGNESAYRIFRISGGAPAGFPNSCPGSPCVNTAANTATIAGVSEFSDWSLGEPGAPTAIELSQFTALAYDDGTMLEWETGFEVDNLGFRIYRQQGGTRAPLNQELVAGSALVAGSGTALTAGRSYGFWVHAKDVGKDTAFWLEDIDLNGASTWHGPVFAKQVGGKPPQRSLAESLSQIGRTRDAGATRAVESFAALSRLPQPSSSPVSLQQASLTASSAIKICVRQAGWYRISQTDLINAGLDPKTDPRNLRLFVVGIELPILVAGEDDGRFDSNDGVEFYGLGLNTASTDTRVYWLIGGSQPGLRINKVPHGKGYAWRESVPYTVERRDRTVYFSALRNGDDENFFGAVIGSTAIEQKLTLGNIAQAARESAIIEVSVQGVTNLAHHVSVTLNGSHIGQLSFNGQSKGQQKIEVPSQQLREGENVVALQSINGPSDISLVESIRISYQHLYRAENDSLGFTAKPGETATVSGFSSKDIRVFDVTDERGVQELGVLIEQGKDGYSATMTASNPTIKPFGSGERRLLGLTANKTLKASSVAANQPSRLRDPGNSADFLIISRANLLSSLKPLIELRSKQGLSTSLVDLEDIHDEFSFGEKSPQSIRDFLSYAATSWKLKPRFVMLAGDASYDARNYLGLGAYDLVPTKLIDTGYMETASDDWFADFNNDGTADIAMGRAPARTAEELSLMVQKIVSYEQSSPADEALLVADHNEGFDFERATTDLRALIPGSLRITQVNRGRVDPETARNSLFEALYRRQLLVNYVGHGSVHQWKGNLLTNDDAMGLRNERLPIFVMMTCLNGYFHDPALDSLGEALLKAERGGAVAVWASSGMTTPAEQALMNQALYRELSLVSGSPIRPPSVRIGEAMQRAKGSVNDADIRRTWILLGDPTTRLR